jgi:phosphopantetheinyl transferase
VPLLETRKLENDVAIAIWKIEENDDYFLRLLDLTVEEQSEIGQMKGRRKTEWLASRWLWNTLSKDGLHGPLIKDDFGKPHILESSWHMSISHTHEYTSVITAPFLVGIDIQIKVDKITRLAEKFLATEELEQVNLSASPIDHLHIYWGAKESL